MRREIPLSARSMTAIHNYSVFGLHVRSELPLPELFEVEPSLCPDILIHLGKVPDPPAPGMGPHVIGGGLLLVIEDVGRYFIRDGAEILVEPQSGVPETNVRLFLLGSAMGALLHQRGLLPLHANAVEIGGKAFAFMGRSGAGKSTLAAWFHDRGHAIIADDVCVVRFDESGRAIASAGLPRLRLWKETLEASGREAASFRRSYAGNPAFDKYDVPIARAAAAAGGTEVAAVYLLEKGDDFGISRLEGVGAADALMANTYRGGFVATVKGEQAHWHACMQLIRTTPIFRAERRWKLDEIDEQCGLLLDHGLGILRE